MNPTSNESADNLSVRDYETALMANQDPPQGASQNPAQAHGQANAAAAQPIRALVSVPSTSTGGRIEYRLHELAKDNYTIWKAHTKNILEARGLTAAILLLRLG